MKTIDVKKAIAKKSKKLANMNFLMNIFRRLLHEDGINQCIEVNSYVHGIQFANGVMGYFDAKVETVFSPQISLDQRYIFASNHPLGGLDGVALISAIGQKFQDIRFPVNDFLLEIKNFDPIFVPINKHGGQGRQSIEIINQSYASNAQILIFPAGLASRKINGNIRDLEWKKHFVQKAIENKRDVVPVHINGQNSKLFYFVANLRKLLKIKFNIEMILLPHEMFRQKGKSLKIKFGNPIPYTTFDQSKTPIEWAKFVQDIVYTM